MLWFSASRMTLSPLVTSAVPLTTIQCSARWWCICRLSEAPGLTMMRLTWWRGPLSMLSYQPQGRCTLRCSVCSSRCSALSWLTISLTSWLRSRLAISTASGVSTTTTSSSPTTLTSRLVACTSVLWLSLTMASPTLALPWASLGATCHTASQAPRSFQPASSATMRMSTALPGHFSITA